MLVADTFIVEMYLKETRFIYNACGLFTKNKERIQKFKGIEDSYLMNAITHITE